MNQHDKDEFVTWAKVKHFGKGFWFLATIWSGYLVILDTQDGIEFRLITSKADRSSPYTMERLR